jgi:hypothetical protein
MCDQCSFEAKQERNLRQHILSSHENVRHACSICPASFKAERNNYQRRLLFRPLPSPPQIQSFAVALSTGDTKKRGSVVMVLLMHILACHENVRHACALCPVPRLLQGREK